MAIIFDKNYAVTDLLTTGNSWIVEFHSNNAEMPTKATVLLLGTSFELAPDPSGKFTFDFKRFFNSTLNADNFEDSENALDIGDSAYMRNPSNHHAAVTCVYQIDFAVSNPEGDFGSYSVKKAVYDPLQFELGNQELDSIFDVLLPKVDGEYYARITPEQPFDISFFSNSSTDNVVVTNTVNSNTLVPNMTVGVCRMFLRDGFENSVPAMTLVDGMNRLTVVKAGIAEPFYINVFQEPSGCKSVLKWFNLEGGWSYFPFIHETENIAAKTNDFIEKDYTSFDSFTSKTFSTGSKLAKEMEHTAVRVPSNEVAAFKGLIASPKVYKRYTKANGSTLWKEIYFKGGDTRLTQTGKNAFDFQLTTFQTENGYTL